MIHIVLFQPEKPMNTGNIMRTCKATGSKLHIIGPLTYQIDDKGLQRAGMDYLIGFEFSYYENYEEFLQKNNNPTIHFITRYGFKAPSEGDFSDFNSDIYVMFGKESTGIPKKILKSDLSRCYRLPMVEDARSLNLSNCVAIVTYEILRQQDYISLSRKEVIKGEDFLLRVNNDG
ncbi:MAG: tRNA (cytidine(34)-2'-O)-methyltransferase [Bacilli bacterium]|nr:tRNA (cytidine(34)-2'-O)-methyltransferase [Bacilli bacterium]